MPKNTENNANEHEVSREDIPELNVGVVGHIDHGKTTLLSKLTGKFTDTHSEELKRGITIKLGYAEIIIKKGSKGVYNTKEGEPIRYVSFIDAPGHEMLMATMLSGAAIIDAAILVVAANEGIKPQTREHFIALKAKNINNIIIVQNKIDLVTKEQALSNYRLIKEFVNGTFAENAPIIPVSALQEVNIDKILEQLTKIPIPKKDKQAEPLFLIARSFDINKPGTNLQDLHGGVLGGILKRGKLRVGDEIEIKPGISTKKAHQYIYKTVSTKILSLHKGAQSVQEIYPGASISIETELDPFITKADALTGCVVGLKGKLPEIVHQTTLKVNLFKEVIGTAARQEVTPIKMNELLMLSVNTAITVGQVLKIKGNEITMALKIPIVDLKGENVGIARHINNHWRLIGFGEIV
jgi:translation initiation factor 2 subunit 3